jgi:methionyl aminopeptidase
MVHLSSAPNEKFTGKKIGSSYPIIPHAITPQQNIDMRRNGVNATTSVPPYAAASNHVPGSEHEQEQEQIITINDKTTINKIRKASQLAAQMLDKACAMAQQQQKEKTGPSSYHTTDEIDKKIHDLLINDIHNAYPSPLNYNNYPKSICCSINEVICHGIPDVRPLKDGDLLSIDVSVYLDGVHGDNCRSIIIGNDSSDGYCDDEIMEQKARAQKLIDATREAMYLAIDICKHGTPLNQIGITIQDVAEEYGFRPMKSVCGHGIGTELHMFPPIKVNVPTRINHRCKIQVHKLQ